MRRADYEYEIGFDIDIYIWPTHTTDAILWVAPKYCRLISQNHEKELASVVQVLVGTRGTMRPNPAFLCEFRTRIHTPCSTTLVVDSPRTSRNGRVPCHLKQHCDLQGVARVDSQ